MVNRRNVIIAAALVSLGVAGFIWFLTGQGLDDAAQWISIVGMTISVILSGIGVAIGWLTLRRSRSAVPPLRVSASGIAAQAIAGNNEGKIDAQLSGVPIPRANSRTPSQGVSASGGAVTAIGGDNRGEIRANVTGTNRRRRP